MSDAAPASSENYRNRWLRDGSLDSCRFARVFHNLHLPSVTWTTDK